MPVVITHFRLVRALPNITQLLGGKMLRHLPKARAVSASRVHQPQVVLVRALLSQCCMVVGFLTLCSPQQPLL